jgi:cytidine deaminase
MREFTQKAPLPVEVLKGLMAEARGARDKAYAPYSGFPVGAAVLSGDGVVFRACNVENGSYGLSVCAERNAVSMLVASGRVNPVAIAVAGPPGVPLLPAGLAGRCWLSSTPPWRSC